jgi:diguanylate cyclase (GGDEF)-like protein
VTERKRMEQALRQQALHDEVTRLPNRLLLSDRLWQVMESNRRNGTLGALIYLGIEHVTRLNGTAGREATDALMCQIALRLQSVVRAMDTVARINDHEFVVVIDKLATNLAESTFEAGYIAEKICSSFTQPFQLPTADQSGKTFTHHCNISAGVTLFANREAKPDDILESAGMAMRRAREAGNNLVRFHEPAAKNGEDWHCILESIKTRSEHLPPEHQ